MLGLDEINAEIQFVRRERRVRMVARDVLTPANQEPPLAFEPVAGRPSALNRPLDSRE